MSSIADQVILPLYTVRPVAAVLPQPRLIPTAILQDAPPLAVAPPVDSYSYKIIAPPPAAHSIMPAAMMLPRGG